MSGAGGDSGRRRGGNFGRNNRGRGRSAGGANGGRKNGARVRSAWDGSSTSSRSSSASSTDHGEMTMVADIRRVTLSLMDVASSAQRLSKPTVSCDYTISVSSGLVRARAFDIATASATTKATLDDSVKRAYFKLSYKNVSRSFMLPFPLLKESNGAQ